MVSEKLVAGIRYLGFKPKIDEQTSRIWIQKVAYLLKVCDYGIDFSFVPYKMGPYSFDLKNDYYANKGAYENLESSYGLTEGDTKILEKVKASVNLDSPRRLEGAASAAMLILTNQTWDDSALMTMMRGWKQARLTDEEIMFAIDDAKRVLFKEEYVTKTITEELEAWEQMSVESVSHFDPESVSPLSGQA